MRAALILVVAFASGCQCGAASYHSVTLGADAAVPDLWLCSCACADPSVAGASIEAAIGGCVVGQFAEDADASRKAACEQACGGTPCGAAEGCALGNCVATTAPPAVASPLTAHACLDSGDFVRLSSAADYLVRLGPESRVLFGTNDGASFRGATTLKLSGSLAINRTTRAGHPAFEFALAGLSAYDPAGQVGGINNLLAVAMNRVVADATEGGVFVIPANTMSVRVVAASDRGQIEDATIENDFPWTGIFDVTGGAFEMLIEGTTVESGAVRLVISGTIENHPPRAIPGPPLVADCTGSDGASVELTAAASTDPDTNDTITHVQWFEGQKGLGNQLVQQAKLKRGHHELTLHVYDKQLSSDWAPLSVDVVDPNGLCP